MKKRVVVAPVGLAAAVLACLAFGVPAQAASGEGEGERQCAPSDGTADATGAWKWTEFTDWSTSNTQPADPDGQDGEGNLDNVIQIGERYEQTVEGPGTPVTTGWLRTSPGEDWVQIAQDTVTDREAYDETVTDRAAYDETVFDHWQRYSWTGGPVTSAPAFPGAGWQANVQGDPHGIGVEGAYKKGLGKGSWFYLKAVTKVVHHPAVTHTEHRLAVTHVEYRYQQTVTDDSHTEYRWSVYERTNVEGNDPIVCDPTKDRTEEPTDEPTEEPTEASPVESPAEESRTEESPTDNSPVNASPAVHNLHAAHNPRAATAAVPTTIDAGL